MSQVDYRNLWIAVTPVALYPPLFLGVTAHIYTGYEPKSSGSGGGVLLYVLTHIYVVYCLSWLFIFFVALWSCNPSNLKEILVTLLFDTAR